MKPEFSRRYCFAGTIAASLGLAAEAAAQGAYDAALALDPAVFTTVNVTLDGKPLALRRYDIAAFGQAAGKACVTRARCCSTCLRGERQGQSHGDGSDDKT